MKIMKVSFVYLEYIKKIYDSKEYLSDKSYMDQWNALLYDRCGWSDSWQHALSKIGYEVHEVIANVKSLQYAWARDHGFIPRDQHWFQEILEWQIQHESPDILFMFDCVSYDPKWVASLKNICRTLKLIIVWCGTPYRSTNILSSYDLVLSCSPEMVYNIRKSGTTAEYLPHAFDPRILPQLSLSQKKYAISFAGSLLRDVPFHREREEILEKLNEARNVDIFSPSYSIQTSALQRCIRSGLFTSAHILKKIGIPTSYIYKIPHVSRGLDFQWGRFDPVSPKLEGKMHPAVYGLDMFQVLADSNIAFNHNSNEVSEKYATNIRMFEATGVGTCLLTDWKEHISDFFEPDKEIVTYRSAEECVEKAKWLLDNPEDRERIAKAGQEKTLREHTFEKRAERFDIIVKNELKQHEAK